MQRLPYGAQTFRDEVKNLYPDALFDSDDRDGLGIYRSLGVVLASKEEAEKLGELLVPIMESSDLRISGWWTNDSTLWVSFTGGDEAENPEPFYLARVADALLPATEKKPAKKTAKKSEDEG